MNLKAVYSKLKTAKSVGPFTTVLLLTGLIDWKAIVNPARTGQYRALFVVAAPLLVNPLRKKIGLPAALFLAYALFMWAMRGMSEHGAWQVAGTTAALFLSLWLAKLKDLPAILTWAATIQAALGLYQYFGGNPFGITDPHWLHKPLGLMGQETILGAFLAACLSPALFTKRYVCAAIIAACAIATSSTMTVLSVGAVAFFWLWRIRPQLIKYALFLSVAGFLYPIFRARILYSQPWPEMDFFSLNLRDELWALGWSAHEARPVFGLGAGGWKDLYVIWKGVRVTYLHSEYLEFLVEHGRVGLSLILLAIGQFFFSLRKTWHHGLVLAVLVNCFGNFTLHIPAIGTLFLTAWVLSVQQSRTVVSFSWRFVWMRVKLSWIIKRPFVQRVWLRFWSGKLG